MPSGPLPPKAGAAYQALRGDFVSAGIATAELDASILLKEVAGFDRLAILARPDALLTEAQVLQLTAARDARLSGKPVHRIIGRRDFFGMPFELSDETLEPRPDSECVVELALAALEARRQEPLSILDIGTGTGILAISLLSRLANANALAVDVSENALATAQRNAELNGVAARFRVIQSDWFEEVRGKFDLIISNPPYIKAAEIAALSPDVREHDPIVALDGGADGLVAYRSIASRASAFLADKGLVALEIGHDQRQSVIMVLEGCGFNLVQVSKDLGGNDRALLFALEG